MKSIEINNISFSYKKSTPVFQDFSLQIMQKEKSGKVTAIMGSSGSGKSTLMKLLLNVEKPQSGNISMHPKNSVISYVPQEAVLFEHLSINDNARYFQFAGAYKNRFNEFLYLDLVNNLGLENIVKSKNSILELSGGQKQRLSLLRALSIEPDFLLLDEPCNGLDAEVKRSFLNKLRQITQCYSLYVLYITHHKVEAQLIADDIVYLIQDKNKSPVSKVAQGSVTKFIKDPPLLEAAHIFRFPDLKILPIRVSDDGIPVIARKEEEINEYWLIENEDLIVGDDNGYIFDVVSKSDYYTVIKNDDANVEWLLPSESIKNIDVGGRVNINIKKKKRVYSVV